jgi:hypothetical protein
MNIRLIACIVLVLFTAASFAQDPAGQSLSSSEVASAETNVLQRADENSLTVHDAKAIAQQALEQYGKDNQQTARDRATFTAHTVSSVVIFLIIVSILLFPLLLLVIGIVVALSTVKKEKKEHTRISREVEKIDAMAASGKINPDEARELKQALGPVAIAEIPREPDTHIKVIGILNIVMPAVKILLLLFLFLGLGFFVAFEGRVNQGVTSGPPLLVFVIIILLGLFFLALVIFRIIAAVALMKGRCWARIVIVVFGVLDLTSFPLGTALGIYTLWTLIFRENAGLYFISENKQ